MAEPGSFPREEPVGSEPSHAGQHRYSEWKIRAEVSVKQLMIPSARREMLKAPRQE